MLHTPHVCSQFPWCAIRVDAKGNVLEVVLPSYNHVVFLSAADELGCVPSLTANRGVMDHSAKYHISAFITFERRMKRLTVTTQETGRLKHGTNDLLAVGRRQELCDA